jgi:hypothetical protein
MAGAPLKTTGPTASFGAVVFSCTKAHSKQCAANMSKDLEADSTLVGLLSIKNVW